MAAPEPKSTSAVLVAGGSSSRMGDALDRKPFLDLAGRTVLERACEAFHRSRHVLEIVVVGREEDLDRIRSLAEGSEPMRKVRRIVPGGELRSDSVRAGASVAREDVALLAVHDVARPLVSLEVVERAIAVAAVRGAALVAVPATDTIKTSSDGRSTESTLDRSVLWSAQTPQVFRRDLLLELLERARAEGYRPTDEAALHERYVGPVPIVPGDAANLKITHPLDVAIAVAVLRGRASATGES